MKKLNYFSKTAVFVIVVTIIAFLTSLFIFDVDLRRTIGLIAFPLGLLAGITFIIMLIVKNWRKASYIPLSIGICSLIVLFIFFLTEGVHFKQNLSKSIESACKTYCKKDNSCIDPKSLKVICIDCESEEERVYSCSAIGTNYRGIQDTITFYVLVDKYNRCYKIKDSYRVIYPKLTDDQLAILDRSGYSADSQVVFLKWDSYWEYLRQAIALELYAAMEYQFVQNWHDVDGWHIQLKIRPQHNLHDLQIAFFFGDLDSKGWFSYAESLGVVNWKGTFYKGRTYSKEFILNKSSNHQYFKCCILAKDVYSDKWLKEYLDSKMDDDFFWKYYANLKDYNERQNKLTKIQSLISGITYKDNISESSKQETIKEGYATLYSHVINNYFIDQFSDSEYNLNNLKTSIEELFKENLNELINR